MENTTSASIANVEENRIRKVDTNKSEVTNAINLTSEIINSIKEGKYPSITGQHCTRCDFLNICRFGQDYISGNKLAY